MANVKELPAQTTAPVELDVEERIELGVGWLGDHKNHILFVVMIGTLIWVGTIGYRNWHNGQMEKANDLYFAAELAFREGLGKGQWASTERSAKMAEAREKAEEVRKEFPKAPVSRAALLLEGDSYFFAGDPVGSAANTGEAIRIYEQYINQATNAEERAIGSLSLGYANENRLFLTGDSAYFQPAVDAYEQVRQNKDSGYIRYEATNALARLNAYVNQTDKAIELYKEVYAARYNAEAPIESAGNAQTAQILTFLRDRSRAFTVGSTARTSLQSLGVDVEALDKEALAHKK